MRPHSTTDPYFPENLEDYAPWVAVHGLRAPYGKCQCGCGEDAPVAKCGSKKLGLVAGKPARFLIGHRGIKKRLPVDGLKLPPGVRAIALTRGQFAIVDERDYEWLSQWKWQAYPNGRNWYASRGGRSPEGGYTTVMMHRAILGVSGKAHVDHINGNGLWNLRSNLRVATPQENSQNGRRKSTNLTGHKGVSYDKRCGKWSARITVAGETKWLGQFDCPLEAAYVYDNAARELHGEFARLNFPESDAP